MGFYFSFQSERVDTSLAAIKTDGPLVVVTRNSPTTYYEGRDGDPEGFEVDLVSNFAASLGVDVEFIVADTVPEILETVADGRAHIAAAGLTVTAEREATHRFTGAYRQVRQLVVCRKNGKLPDKVEDLTGIDLVVTEGSSYTETLRRLKEDHPDIVWREDSSGPETLMQAVWESEIDCTVADEPIYQVTRRHFPELVRAFALTPETPLAWIIAPGADELAETVDEWLESKGTARLLERLIASHFGFFPEFDYVNLARLHTDIEKVLPEYESDLRTAARRNNLPWRLLAAVAYQESKWDPEAVSATGVRGIMMLTQSTAKRVGVSDRMDPKESIWGGARYLAELVDRVPEGVTGDDRYWFALAAYNMGMGHVYDARTLAERRGLDKNVWVDVKKVLDLLSQQPFYSTLRHGYARGYEAKRYVERVRTYWHVLKEQR